MLWNSGNSNLKYSTIGTVENQFPAQKKTINHQNYGSAIMSKATCLPQAIVPSGSHTSSDRIGQGCKRERVS